MSSSIGIPFSASCDGGVERCEACFGVLHARVAGDAKEGFEGGDVVGGGVEEEGLGVDVYGCWEGEGVRRRGSHCEDLLEGR